MDLPDDMQRFMIRTKYFPQPSREDEIQVNLYMRKAFDEKSAVFLESTPNNEAAPKARTRRKSIA